MKTYVIGDLHGELEKLKTLLAKVNFDFDNDTLISLGDIVDRGPDSFGCVELLLKIKNLIAIRGNHDAEWLHHLKTGDYPSLAHHGALKTIESYQDAGVNREVHLDFFAHKQLPYYIDEQNNCFVHGGFNRHFPIVDQDESILCWDRDLFMQARSYKNSNLSLEFPFKIHDKFKEIFLGHTPTTYFNSSLPLNSANIWNLDTGSGKGGLLTIMDLESKVYFQA